MTARLVAEGVNGAEGIMTPLLAAEDIHFAYGSRAVLGGVSFEVHPGEIVALAGPNGAGKTTLLKLLAGLLVPSLGRVHAFVDRPRAIAYLAQSEELPQDWSVREVVELGRIPHAGLWRDLTARDDRSVRLAMECTEVLSLSERRVAALSGGERQRVAVARALAQEPRVLLLDEPTVHLDPRHQVALIATLRAQATRGLGILMVVHDFGLATIADRCVLLSGGTVRAAGPPADVLNADVLRDVYEIEVEVLRTSDDRIVISPMPSARIRGLSA